MTTPSPTLRDVLPPRARKVTYAVLAFVVPVTTTAVALFADGFQATDVALLVGAAASAAGFGMAAANTDKAA